METIQIWTDGAYSSLRDQGGIGIVIIKDEKKLKEYSKKYLHTTNNQMELGAVIVALAYIQIPYEKITIFTDSQYVIGGAVKGWKREKNRRLWREFDKQFQRVSELCKDIKFEHVRGHKNIYWNEYVDDLARKASQLI
jgi:ribonuclease HI